MDFDHSHIFIHGVRRLFKANSRTVCVTCNWSLLSRRLFKGNQNNLRLNYSVTVCLLFCSTCWFEPDLLLPWLSSTLHSWLHAFIWSTRALFRLFGRDLSIGLCFERQEKLISLAVFCMYGLQWKVHFCVMSKFQTLPFSDFASATVFTWVALKSTARWTIIRNWRVSNMKNNLLFKNCGQ
jgi:hypothetical protein